MTSQSIIIGLREPGQLTWGKLRRLTRNVAHSLRELGVQSGDRVAAYMPNVPEALVAMTATTGIGALWSVAPQTLCRACR